MDNQDFSAWSSGHPVIWSSPFAVKINMQTVKNESAIIPSFIEFSSGKRLAYHLSEGKSPGVVFFGGFRSDMTGAKALALEALCKADGRRFLRFDYSGHGQSSGDFTEGTIGEWKQDALDILDHIAPGENILVGSSMGGWIMLLAALARPDRVRGLVGIASAPDFTEMLLWGSATEAQKKQLRVEGLIHVPSCYGQEPYPISYRLIEEGRSHLLLNGDIPLTCPVRLLHGTGDEDVPYRVSEQLMQRLAATDVTLTLVKGGGHRLSEPAELAMIGGMVRGLQED